MISRHFSHDEKGIICEAFRHFIIETQVTNLYIGSVKYNQACEFLFTYYSFLINYELFFSFMLNLDRHLLIFFILLIFVKFTYFKLPIRVSINLYFKLIIISLDF